MQSFFRMEENHVLYLSIYPCIILAQIMGADMALAVKANLNHLIKDSEEYFFRSGNDRVTDTDALAKKMSLGKTTLSESDISACLKLLYDTLILEIASGTRVKLGFGQVYLTAKGSVHGEKEPFVPNNSENNHEIKVHFKVDPVFEAAASADVEIERVAYENKALPQLHHVNSVKSKLSLSGKPGEYIEIKGLRLKFDPEHPDTGVFFVNGSEYRAASYIHTTCSDVHAEVPSDIPPGNYSLIVRTMPNGKDVIEGKHLQPFIVI